LGFTPIALQVVPYLLVAVGVDNLFIVARQFDIRTAEVEAAAAASDTSTTEPGIDDEGATSRRRGAKATVMAESLGLSVPSVGITSITSCVALLIAGTTEAGRGVVMKPYM